MGIETAKGKNLPAGSGGGGGGRTAANPSRNAAGGTAAGGAQQQPPVKQFANQLQQDIEDVTVEVLFAQLLSSLSAPSVPPHSISIAKLPLCDSPSCDSLELGGVEWSPSSFLGKISAASSKVALFSRRTILYKGTDTLLCPPRKYQKKEKKGKK